MGEDLTEAVALLAVLAADLEVDTHRRDGARLPQVRPVSTADASAVFDALGAQADARVNAIIAANEGKSAGGAHRVAYAASPAR